MYDTPITNINELNPDLDQWKIIATVKSRTQLKKGASSDFFFATLRDQRGNEITLKFFDEAALHFDTRVRVNTRYIIQGTGDLIQPARASTFSRAPYEIVANDPDELILRETQSQPENCRPSPSPSRKNHHNDDDDETSNSIMNTSSGVVRIKEALARAIGEFLSTAGYVASFDDIDSGNGKKRTDVQLKDAHSSIRVVFWGGLPGQDKLKAGDLMIITNLKVGQYNNSKNLTSTVKTKILKTEDELKKVSFIQELIREKPRVEVVNHMQASNEAQFPQRTSKYSPGKTCAFHISCVKNCKNEQVVLVDRNQYQYRCFGCNSTFTNRERSPN